MFAGRSIVLVIENSNCVRAFEITISKQNPPQKERDEVTENIAAPEY